MRSVTDEDEDKFWCGTAKQLSDTICLYHGGMFGLCGSGHRKICLNNFSLSILKKMYATLSMEVLLTLSIN